MADVHKNQMPDANERLEKFIASAITKEVDFIILLGDFCMAETITLGNRHAKRNLWKYVFSRNIRLSHKVLNSNDLKPIWLAKY